MGYREAEGTMPIYEYQAAKKEQSCPQCAEAFEVIQRMNDAPLSRCPKCGAPVQRLISAPCIGKSESSFDDRAKNAGFHKLQKLGKGEYEKQY